MKILDLVNILMNNPCHDPNILKVILFIRKIMEVAFIAIPIVLIVLITFDFIKNVMAGKEDVQKKNQKIVIKRLIYAVMVFFVLPIVNIVFGAFTSSEQTDLIGEEFNGATVNYLTCWTNADSLDTINSFVIKVKFDGNGGNVYGEAEKTCGGKEACEITNLPRATKKGEYFIGWSPTKDGCGFPIEGNTIIANNTVLQTKETEDVFDETYYACFEPNPVEPSKPKPANPTGGNYEDINTELPTVKYGESKQIVTVYDKDDKKVFVYRCPIDYYIESGTNSQRVTTYSCKKKESDGTYSSSTISKMIIPKYVQWNYKQKSTCDSTATLSAKGCLPTSGAMIFGALQNDLTLTPDVMNSKAKDLKNKGYNVCSGKSYYVDFLISYSSSVGISNRTINAHSADTIYSIFKSNNAMGVAPLKKKASCYNNVKDVCYDSVYHFVLFFPAENLDSGYVNVIDPNDKNDKIINVKLSDLINSTQNGLVRIFYK